MWLKLALNSAVESRMFLLLHVPGTSFLPPTNCWRQLVAFSILCCVCYSFFTTFRNLTRFLYLFLKCEVRYLNVIRIYLSDFKMKRVTNFVCVCIIPIFFVTACGSSKLTLRLLSESSDFSSRISLLKFINL